MQSITGFVLALVSVSLAEDSCWEKCFVNPPDIYKHEYTHLHHLVQLVRGARVTYNIHGTAILLDSTATNPTEWSYEKMLARLVVLSAPVGQSNNLFFMAQYSTGSAWSYGSWDCQSSCQASDTIGSFASQGNQTATDTVFIGCNLASKIMDPSSFFGSLADCIKDISKRRMVVAFMNSNVDSSSGYPQCDNFDARVAIRILPTASKAWNLTPAFSRPLGPTMDFETSYTGLNGVPNNTVNALTGLLSCMEERCCSTSNLYFDARTRLVNADFEDKILVSTKGSQGVKFVDKAGLQAELNKAAKA